MREADVLPVQDEEAAAPRKPGRPRSERADKAILDAALDLFAESGAGGVCIEAVAARAGVGKATIYRRWPGKEDLLLEALSTLKSPLPEPRGASVREDLVAMVGVMVEDAADPRRMRRYNLLHGEGEKYPKLMERYRHNVVEPRRELMRSVLRRGAGTGEIRADADVEVAILLLIGATIARSKHETEQPPPGFAERVVDQVLLGLTPR